MTLTSSLGNLVATTQIDKTGLTRDMQAVRELLNAERLTLHVDTSALGGPSVSIERLTVGVGELTAKLEALSRRAPIKMPDVERISSEATTAARGVGILTSQLQRGAIDTGTYDQRTRSLIATLQNGAAQAGQFSREAAMLEGNLLKVAKIQVKPQLSPMDKAYWQAVQEDSRRTAAAVAAQWKTEMATARQAVTRAMNLRQDWQGGSVGDTAALERLNAMRQGYQQTQTAIQGQIDKLQQLGVMDEQQTKRVQVLEQQYRAYGNAVRNLGSIEASIQGTIQKGSLADSMSRGITASAQQAGEAVRLLQAQEQAGIITKRELATALNGEVSSLRASITATQAKAAELRSLGALDVQQTAELNALTAAELRYTETLGRTIAAQEAAARSSSLLRQGMGAAGGRGMGLNNAAMAASFVSPELGMVGMAASLHAMNPEVAVLLQKMDKVQEYLGYVSQVAGAFGTLAGAMGETEQEYDNITGAKLQTPWKDLAANIQGVVAAMGQLQTLVSDVKAVISNPGSISSWVGLVTNVVSSIGNALSGYQKQKAQLAQVKDDFTSQNPLLNPGDYQKAYLKSKGFFGDIFGGGPTVVNEIDKIGMKFATTMQSAFTEGISNGLEQAISQNDFSEFSKTLHQSVYKGLEQGIVDAFLNDTLLKNIVGPAIKQWSDALKSGDQGQMAAALTGIDAAMSQVDTQANAFYAQVAPKLQQYRSEWQIDTSSSGGNVNTNDLRTLPEPVQFALATPLLDGVNSLKDAAATLQEAAGSIRDTFKDGIKVVVQQGSTTYTSTTGALAGV